MTLISCSEKCIHQSEGYCMLDAAAAVTDTTVRGCIHQEKPVISSLSINRPAQKRPL